MNLFKSSIIDWTNREQVLNAVKSNKDALKYATFFKDDKEVVLLAVKCNGLAIQYASPRLKNDPEVVFEAIKNNGEALKFVDQKFANSKKFMLEAMRTFPYAFMLNEGLYQSIISNKLFDEKTYSLRVTNSNLMNFVKDYFSKINESKYSDNNVSQVDSANFQNNTFDVNSEMEKLFLYLSYIKCNNVDEFYKYLDDFIKQRQQPNKNTNFNQRGSNE